MVFLQLLFGLSLIKAQLQSNLGVLLGPQFEKVLECSSANGSEEFGIQPNILNITVESYVRQAQFQRWPPIERLEGSSRVYLQYLYSSVSNYVADLKFFNIPCKSFQEDAQQKYAYIRGLETSFEISSRDTEVVKQYSVEQLVNSESVTSAAVLVDDKIISCCNLVPEFPDLPTEFSVVVEANMASKGYSMIQKEYYSQTRKGYRIDTFTAYGNEVTIQDFSQQIQYKLTLANTSFPNGECQTSAVVEQNRLFSAQYLLFFDENILSNVQFVSSEQPAIIRGVPCERWIKKIDSDGTGPQGFNGSYEVEIYFAYAGWSIARVHEHRQLMRTRVTGINYLTRKSVEHIYEYVDFIPSVPEDVAFEPCQIIPLGLNCQCSLADKQGIPQELAIAPTERETADGAICIFPFFHNGVLYQDCAKIGNQLMCPDINGDFHICQLYQENSQGDSLQQFASIKQNESSSCSSKISSRQSGNSVLWGFVGAICGTAIGMIVTYVVTLKMRRKRQDYKPYVEHEMELTNGVTTNSSE